MPDKDHWASPSAPLFQQLTDVGLAVRIVGALKGIESALEINDHERAVVVQISPHFAAAMSMANVTPSTGPRPAGVTDWARSCYYGFGEAALANLWSQL
jgi:hypothetical protein